MAEVHDILLDARKTVFDTLTPLFFDNATELKLLKQSDATNVFDEITTLDDSWFFQYSEFRQNFLLQISRDDDDLTEEIQEATHVQIDDDVYVIRTGDTLPPKGTDVTWKLFCERFAARSQFQSLY